MVWEELILSMLAVSSYPLDRALAVQDRLRSEGIFVPQNLAHWSVGETVDRLRAGGYDRGKLTPMYADRLVSLGKLVSAQEPCELARILQSGSDRDVHDALLPIYGIGPVVIRNFLALRRSRSRT